MERVYPGQPPNPGWREPASPLVPVLGLSTELVSGRDQGPAFVLLGWEKRDWRNVTGAEQRKKNAELGLIIDGTRAGRLDVKYSEIAYPRKSRHGAEIAQLGER